LGDDYLPVPGSVSAKLALARPLVFQPLKLELGLQAAKMMLVGLAPVRRSTLELFASLDLPLCEAWGLTEAGGPVAVNAKDSRRLGTQGRPLPGVAVRIAGDGEILLHTDTACLPSPDGEPMFDRHGWLRTGDLGQLDSDGFVTVSGRKDEQLPLRGRRRASAMGVEARLREMPLVRHAVAYADGRSPVALLSLDESRRQGLDGPGLLALLERDLALVQREAPETERVRHFAVVPGGFSLAEGELTAAGTVRREVIARRRAGLIGPLLEKEPRPKRASSRS
jgi:long-chain acyl-CoA synthetase